MKFTTYPTSDYPNRTEVEFKTLEEFLKWCDKQTSPVIISNHQNDWELEVYDDYRE